MKPEGLKVSVVTEGDLDFGVSTLASHLWCHQQVRLVKVVLSSRLNTWKYNQPNAKWLHKLCNGSNIYAIQVSISVLVGGGGDGGAKVLRRPLSLTSPPSSRLFLFVTLHIFLSLALILALTSILFLCLHIRMYKWIKDISLKLPHSHFLFIPTYFIGHLYSLTKQTILMR